MPKPSRPDLHDLIVGRLYVDNYNDTTLEFVGAREESGEYVAVFADPETGGEVVYNRADYNTGQTFQPFADRVADEIWLETE